MITLHEGIFKIYEERGFTYLVMNRVGSEQFTVGFYRPNGGNVATLESIGVTFSDLIKVRAAIRKDADQRFAERERERRAQRR